MRRLLDWLVVELGLQLFVLGHLPDGLHEVLVQHVVAFSSENQSS